MERREITEITRFVKRHFFFLSFFFLDSACLRVQWYKG